MSSRQELRPQPPAAGRGPDQGPDHVQDHAPAAAHFIASSDEAGLRLHLRARNDDPQCLPVLFVHGATYASPLYDIPATGVNWLDATAEAGFAAYALDIRGYGRSHPAFAPDPHTPYARAEQAVRDIADAARA